MAHHPKTCKDKQEYDKCYYICLRAFSHKPKHVQEQRAQDYANIWWKFPESRPHPYAIWDY